MAVRAPRLESGLWFNAQERPLSELRGKVVLLDFFTYGCVNCLNNLYTIKKLRKRYGPELVIIGIHSAKFEREGDTAHLKNAIDRLGIDYPVIDDSSLSLFDNYAIKAWPTVVLIDRDGYLVETFSGEQRVETLEKSLAALDIFPLDEHISEIKRDDERLHFPQKVQCEDSFLLIANTGADAVWLCDYEGKILKKFEGLSEPMGMAVLGDLLYIANRGRDEIVAIDLKTYERNVILDGLRAPYDLELSDETLFVAMAASHQIVAYSLNDLSETARYGNGFEALRDGDALSSQLAQPSGVTLLYDQLWFVDAESSSLRLIVEEHVHTAIGEGLFSFGDVDEGAILLQHPQGVVAGQYGDGCGGGRIFVADTFNDKVKAYNPEDGSIITLFSGLHAPAGIAKKGCRLYIADTDAHRIIMFDLSKMSTEVMRFSL